MTNEEEKKSDVLLILVMLDRAADTPFQKDIILSCMEHFSTTYRDYDTFSTMLTLFTDKFKIENP